MALHRYTLQNIDQCKEKIRLRYALQQAREEARIRNAHVYQGPFKAFPEIKTQESTDEVEDECAESDLDNDDFEDLEEDELSEATLVETHNSLDKLKKSLNDMKSLLQSTLPVEPEKKLPVKTTVSKSSVRSKSKDPPKETSQTTEPSKKSSKKSKQVKTLDKTLQETKVLLENALKREWSYDLQHSLNKTKCLLDRVLNNFLDCLPAESEIKKPAPKKTPPKRPAQNTRKRYTGTFAVPLLF